MKLKSIRAENLKGLSFTLDLRSINFLVGSNFAGKTARTDAIRLLLLGYLPELGKLPKSTFEICSGKELVVVGEFDNGVQIKRRWYLKGDTVKSENNITVADVSSATSAEEIFENDAQLAVMLNAETYFALSDRDRVAYVFANIPGLGASYTPDKIIESVASEVSGAEDPPDEKAVERFAIAFEEAKTTVESESTFTTWTPQSFLDFALEVATEAQKGAKQRAAVFEKTTQGLMHLRTQEKIEVDIPAIEATKTKLTRELEELQQEKGKHNAAFDSARANRRRRDELTLQVRAKSGFESQRESFKKQIDKLAKERDAIPSVEDMDALRTDHHDASNAENDHLRQLREVEEAITRNERELADIGGKTACPYCGATGEGWKALKEGEINSALSGLRTKRDQLKEHLVALRDHALRSLNRVTQAKTNHGLRDGKEREIRSAQMSLESVEKNIAVLEGKAEELARIPADDPATVAAVETAQTSINVKRDELYQVEQKRNAFIGRTHDLKRLAEAEKGRDDAKVDETVAKLAAAALRSIKERMVAEAFGPLLATANVFFQDILKTPLAYRDGEIGTWRDGTWVGHRTFSGTEKALAYAAIQAALSSDAPVRIMVMDELGRLDDENAARLVNRIAAAVKAGKIEQFVGIDTGRIASYQTDAEMEGADLTVTVIS